MNNSYNPGWKSDQELIDGFIARHDLFAFLRDELARAPLHGNVQHYLLVGMRGAGKTTMLQRLAVAMRQDADLSDHLIPLSFPEELYQVKNLADFWWAACEALYDALDGTSRHAAARALDQRIDSRPDDSQQPNNDSGLVLLQQTCATIGRRPVLLVDNLDLVLQRIDKKGRKLHDPQAPAYWSLREALSTLDAPIVIGGSVRLTDSFVEYDNVFYDFFVPKRLGKLSLAEVEAILAHLASNNDAASLKERLDTRPGRIQAIYEMTGGNPRAISLIVDLFRKGVDSRAVDDFARLMDLSTPYYKARFEDLSEQAQVVLHALALAKKPETKGNGFGYTAAAVAKQAGLETRIVSAQMDVLVDEGVVEKIGGKGRTQYRVAEQLFRLWMQMRSTRRIRANVQGLVEFLEEMFDEEELRNLPPDAAGAKPLNLATWAFARSEMSYDHARRYGLKAHATHQLLRHTADTDEQFSDFIGPNDLPATIALASKCRDRLQRCKTWRAKLDSDDQAAILKLPGSLKLNQQQKEAAIDLVCAPESTTEELKELVLQIARERVPLEKFGWSANDIDLLYAQRAQGNLSLPDLTPSDLENVVGVDAALRSLAWKLLVARMISVQAPETASAWIDWALIHATNATAREWQSVANHIGNAHHYGIAETAYRKAIALDPENSLSWYNLAVMLEKLQRLDESILAYRKALEFDPRMAAGWNNLAAILMEQKRLDEAETAVRKALEVDPVHAGAWSNLGLLLSEWGRLEEAETAFRQAVEQNPKALEAWNNLAILLNEMKRYDEALMVSDKLLSFAPSMSAPWQNRGIALNDLKRFDEAEAAFRRAIELDSADAGTWGNLGVSLANLKRYPESEATFRKSLELDPTEAKTWANLGLSLARQQRYAEAEAAFRKNTLLTPTDSAGWSSLGTALAMQERHEEAEMNFREAIKLAPSDATGWNDLARALDNMQRDDEAEAAYIRAAELEPESEIRHIRLGDFRNQRALKTAASAAQARDWAALREHLLPLMEETRRPARWQVSKTFIEDLVAPALQRGDGLPLLGLLREIGLDKTALPLMLALEAAIGSDPERLSDVEPEVRTAALKMFERLGTPASKS